MLGRNASGLVLLGYDPAADAWRDLPTPPADAAALFAAGEGLYAMTRPPGGPAGLFRLG